MILGIFPSAKAEVITGVATVSTGIVGHISWANDIFPIITEVAVTAGAIIALHGIYTIIVKEVKNWKDRRLNYTLKDKLIDKDY